MTPSAACATRRHDSVDGLVDAAVAAGDDELRRTAADGLPNLVFEVPDVRALVHFDVDAGGFQQLQDARQAPFRAAAAGCRIQE